MLTKGTNEVIWSELLYIDCRTHCRFTQRRRSVLLWADYVLLLCPFLTNFLYVPIPKAPDEPFNAGGNNLARLLNRAVTIRVTASWRTAPNKR